MSTRYVGGLITKTPPTLNPALGNAANGVFTMSQYMQAVKNATWPGFDPYFKQTVLLLHGDGTNGAQNNTFLDSSTNNFTITRNGNTTQGTFSPFSVGAGEWSNYFDGSGDYLTIPSSSNLAFGTGDFCVDVWFYVSTTGVKRTVYSNAVSSIGGDAQLEIQIDTSNKVALYGWFTGFLIGATSVVSNTWNHVAICRSGTTLSLFLNGVRDATTTSANNFSSTNAFNIGREAAGGGLLTGYISNLRAVKGSSVYDPSQTTITVPTAPLTAVSNTQLLTCQSNRFVDNSTNAFTITRNGDVRVTPFSPFAPSAAYDPAVNGGSGYFDGSGDYLTVADNVALRFGTGDFAIEFWYNGVIGTTNQFVVSKYTTYASNMAYVVGILRNNHPTNPRGFLIWVGNTTYETGSGSIQDNTWYHIAVTRESGSVKIFVNGSQVGATQTITNDITNTATLNIGRSNENDSFVLGYVSNVRFVKGSAVYTSNFTPPTAPLTAITNTSLLCNFTNAGIFDNTGKNNLETVGNAQIDTTTKKYGTGSMEFDGTGDWLQGVVTQELNFGTGNFTIEGWINVPLSDGTYRCILSIGAPVQIYNRAGTIECYFNDEDNGSTYIVNGMLGPSSSISANTWAHFAVVRNGTTFTAYINGVAGTPVTSVSAAVALSATPMKIGVAADNTLPFTGFIDDLRITKGVARYTANFTAQTSQWQDQ